MCQGRDHLPWPVIGDLPGWAVLPSQQRGIEVQQQALVGAVGYPVGRVPQEVVLGREEAAGALLVAEGVREIAVDVVQQDVDRDRRLRGKQALVVVRTPRYAEYGRDQVEDVVGFIGAEEAIRDRFDHLAGDTFAAGLPARVGHPYGQRGGAVFHYLARRGGDLDRCTAGRVEVAEREPVVLDDLALPAGAGQRQLGLVVELSDPDALRHHGDRLRGGLFQAAGGPARGPVGSLHAGVHGMMGGVGGDHEDVCLGCAQAEGEGRTVENLTVGIEDERLVAAGVGQRLPAQRGRRLATGHAERGDELVVVAEAREPAGKDARLPFVDHAEHVVGRGDTAARLVVEAHGVHPRQHASRPPRDMLVADAVGRHAGEVAALIRVRDRLALAVHLATAQFHAFRVHHFQVKVAVAIPRQGDAHVSGGGLGDVDAMALRPTHPVDRVHRRDAEADRRAGAGGVEVVRHGSHQPIRRRAAGNIDFVIAGGLLVDRNEQGIDWPARGRYHVQKERSADHHRAVPSHRDRRTAARLRQLLESDPATTLGDGYRSHHILENRVRLDGDRELDRVGVAVLILHPVRHVVDPLAGFDLVRRTAERAGRTVEVEPVRHRLQAVAQAAVAAACAGQRERFDRLQHLVGLVAYGTGELRGGVGLLVVDGRCLLAAGQRQDHRESGQRDPKQHSVQQLTTFLSGARTRRARAALPERACSTDGSRRPGSTRRKAAADCHGTYRY